MSLVNDMLRDLDKRKQPGNEKRRTGVLVNVDVESKPLLQTMQALLVVVVIVAALGGAYVLMSGGDSEEAETAAIVPPQVIPQENPSAILVQEEMASPVPEIADAIDTDEDQFEVPLGSMLQVSEMLTAEGFVLYLYAETEFPYQVNNKTPLGLSLLLNNVAEYQRPQPEISGLSLLQNGAQLAVELELNKAAEIQVYRDTLSQGYKLVISATYNQQESLVQSPEQTIVDGVAMVNTPPVGQNVTETVPDKPQVFSNNDQVKDPLAAAESTVPKVAENAPAATAVDETALQQPSAVRKNRGLSLQQLDLSASQKAMALVQKGQLHEAYDQLLTFVNENPEAHQSRETLGTVLYAQNEFDQAEAVIDEGLGFAPNYAPFKKIKARLLMRKGATTQALNLLRGVTPPVETDIEYHELLASLYQQNYEYSLAETSYQQLLRTNSNVGRWWVALAISMDLQGKTKDAIAGYRVALEKGIEDVNVRRYAQNRMRELGTQ